jgi:DtxR family transcriptional regulator, Mn-dependent transcriptional regulator
MPSPTVENYLKQIYLEQQRAPDDLVSMGRLATAMRVVPGTATAMIKALSDSGLVSYEPRSGVRLTGGGQQLALHVLRRHRLVELFLVKTLGLDWSEVHAEAEELEHAISDKVLDRIDALLGHPSVDPHGDPIPTAGGDVVASPAKSLANCTLDRPMRVARIMDQEPNFLQFVNRCGLVPGVSVIVQSRDEVAQAAVVRAAKQRLTTLGMNVAAKILVEPSD